MAKIKALFDNLTGGQCMGITNQERSGLYFAFCTSCI